MPCEKCGYKDKKEIKKFDKELCYICASFAPDSEDEFSKYISEKIDWKILDIFRKYNSARGLKQKKGMQQKAEKGMPVNRAPLGYDIKNRMLIENQDSSKVHSIFTTFLNTNFSLSALSRNFDVSINGLKKILTNRAYLGEIKFNNKISKGLHNPLISPEIFYAVQRKLKNNHL